MMIDLPDDLLRAVEARAVSQGQSLEDLVADALNLFLQTSTDATRPTIDALPRRTRFPIIEAKDPTRRLTPEMVAAAERLLAEEIDFLRSGGMRSLR